MFSDVAVLRERSAPAEVPSANRLGWRPIFKKYESVPVTKHELRSIRDLKIEFTMPCDEKSGRRRVSVVLRHRHRPEHIYFSLGCELRILLFWLFFLTTIVSSSALQITGSIFRSRGQSASPLGRLLAQLTAAGAEGAPRQGRAQHLAKIFAAISSTGPDAAAAAASNLFTTDIEYEDMLLGLKVVGVESVLDALRHHPHLLSDTLPRTLLGRELPRLSLTVVSASE